MENNEDHWLSLSGVSTFLRKCLFSVLSFGPMPNSIAFIMDGNRRYTKSRKLDPGSGHRVGSVALTSILQYCYELGVRYVTVYAFSIDNFKRKPEEVDDVMNLILEKIEELLEEGNKVDKYGLRINFWGDLNLLKENVRLAARKAMTQTAKNNGPVLSICVAYTSSHEIFHAIEESCKAVLLREKIKTPNGYQVANGNDAMVSVADIEKHLFTANYPDPDMLVRTSGETRLSNFLLWQTDFCHLQNPLVLWPDFSLRHLVLAILEYQRAFPYIEKARKAT